MDQRSRIRILFLSSNPPDTGALRLDMEHRTIEERLRGAPFGDRFELISGWALRVQDLQASLLRHRPQIVHFSGHGTEDGSITLESASGKPQRVTAEALVSLFQLLRETVRCLVLNACHSDVQAKALSSHLDCVIGMSTSVGDGAAIAFSSAFYQALASGESVNTAFEFGCNQIQLEDLGEDLTPTLYVKDGLKPLRFVSEPTAAPPSTAPSRDILSIAQAIAAMLVQQSSPATILGTEVSASLSFLSRLSPNTTLPSPVDRYVSRSGSVRLIAAEYDHHSYVAVHGGSSTGKTQLAILTALASSGERVWIPLRRRTDGAALKISLAILGTEPRFQGKSRIDALREVCAALPQESIIVLDDLPLSGGQDDFDDILAELCVACQESRVRLLSTSAKRLPRRTRDRLGKSLAEMPAPPFLDKEVEQLFRSHAAPDTFLRSKWRRFVQASAKQHPVLLVEAARYLESRGWSTSDDIFDDLVLGRFARSLNLTTTEDIVRTVPDARTREFLYRLRLIDSPFTAHQASDVASVSPSIPAPHERLAELLGLWVQQDSGSEFVVSPLVSSLDDTNISPEVRMQVHRVIASGVMGRVFEKGTFGPEEAIQAIVHSVKADEFDQAGTVLIMALHGLSTQRPLDDPFGLSSIWVGMPLPAAMNHETKVGVRALQIVVRHRLGRGIEDLLDDFEALLRVLPAGDRTIVRVGFKAIVGVELVFERPETAIRYFLDCIQGLTSADLDALRDEQRQWSEGLLTLFWIAGFSANTSQSFSAWFRALQSLNSGQISALQTAQLADRCCDFICSHVWMREADRPTSERDWDAALQVLNDLAQWARDAHFPLLEACAVRGQVVVYAEYKNDLAAATRLGEIYLADPRDAVLRFLIRDIVARQLAYQDRINQSLEWFAAALQDARAAPIPWRVEALANAGCAASKGCRDTAITFFDEAIRLFESDPGEVPPLWWVKITGETALAEWRLGRRAEAFRAWSHAVERLLALMTEDEDWIILYCFVGAYTSYFGQCAWTDGPLLPGTFEPTPGRLLLAPKGIAEVYERGQEWKLAGSMALFADTMLDDNEAIEWGLRFVRMASADEDRSSRISFSLYALPRQFGAGNYEPLLLDAVHDDEFAARTIAETPGPAGQQLVLISKSAATIKVALVVLDLGRLASQDREFARTVGLGLSNSLRSANTVKSAFWEHVATVFAEFLTIGSAAKLFADANSTRDNELKIITGLAAVYDADLHRAANLHITLLRRLQGYCPNVVFRCMVAPKVREFWARAFEGLTLHATGLPDSIFPQNDDRVQATLVVVRSILDLAISSDDHTWLTT